MKSVAPSKIKLRFMRDMKALLKKHANDLSATEVLALSAHLTGTLIALQDQTRYTTEQIMELVTHNIQCGNKAAIDEIMNPQGSS